MKKWAIIACALVSLALIIALFFIFSPAGKEDYPFALGSGRLREISKETNDAGHAVIILADDDYTYRYNFSLRQLQTVLMNTARCEEIVEAAEEKRLESAEPDLELWLGAAFPEADYTSLETELHTGSGSTLEAKRYSVKEWQGDILLNWASLSFTEDGRLCMLVRSNNIMPAAEQKVSEAEAVELAAQYLGIGGEFKELNLEKVVYGECVAWHIECSVEKGTMDTYYALYIDIESGELIEPVLTTSAEE